MLNNGFCSACQSLIPPERLYDQAVVCAHCGHIEKSKHSRKQTAHRVIMSYLGLSVLALGALIHIFHWDKYALEIVPLKSFQITQSASSKQLLRIAEICTQRMHHDCTEQALLEASLSSSEPLSILQQLGQLQIQRNKDLKALETYSKYFSHGGRDLKSMYNFAVLLGQQGQPDLSEQYFDRVLAETPSENQVGVTRSYIQMLMAHEQHHKAKRFIEKIRRSSKSANAFMQDELNQINRALRVARR